MRLTLAVANQAAAENLEADLEVDPEEDLEVDRDLAAAVGNLEAELEVDRDLAAAAENLEADPKVDLDLAAAAENLEADLEVARDPTAAVEKLEAVIKEIKRVIVLNLVLDRVLDHHPQPESLLPPNLRVPLHRRRLALGKVALPLLLLRPTAPNQLEHRSLQRREKWTVPVKQMESHQRISFLKRPPQLPRLLDHQRQNLQIKLQQLLQRNSIFLKLLQQKPLFQIRSQSRKTVVRRYSCFHFGVAGAKLIAMR